MIEKEVPVPIQITLTLKDPAVHALLIAGRHLQVLSVNRGNGEVLVRTVPLSKEALGESYRGDGAGLLSRNEDGSTPSPPAN